MRDFQFPGRSPVYAERGMISTSHPLATGAGLEVLKAGGSAADAAITASAVMAVVEPQMTGLGGDCFCLIAQNNQPIWGYNGSGRAPKALSSAFLREKGLNNIPLSSPHAVSVPGAVEAWETILHKFGKFDLARALKPAIHYAQEGYYVAPRIAYDWQTHVKRLQEQEMAAQLFLKQGLAPKVGEKMHNLPLAQTLKEIASKGSRGFYEGWVADDIVKSLQQLGGLMHLEDLANHKGSEETPLYGTYKNVTLAELPPNGQGITALIILNILENLSLSGVSTNSATRIHYLIEASRLAYALRDEYISDPKEMRVSPAQLLDKSFAKSLFESIDPLRRNNHIAPKAPGSHTIYLSVVDENGMAVSFINSIFHAFGSCLVGEKSGVLLQNRGASFNLKQGHVNELKGGKRPMHTIIPAMIVEKGLASPFGVMGGSYQSTGHAHVLSNMVDYGQDPQAAIDAPRAFFEGDKLTLERGFNPQMRNALQEKGHQIHVPEGPIGGAQIIKRHASGLLIAGSDGRKDGLALGY